MNITKKVVVFGAVFATIACFLFVTYFRDDPNDYVRMADRISASVEDKLVKRYKMHVVGTIGGMAGSVNVIGLAFQIQGPLKKEKLREIVVDCVEEFLTSTNRDEKIRPFLKNFPFTESEIEIIIHIVDKSGRRVNDPDIAVVGAFKGIIWYATKEKNVRYGYKQEFQEDYQTALKLVKGEKPVSEKSF